MFEYRQHITQKHVNMTFWFYFLVILFDHIASHLHCFTANECYCFHCCSCGMIKSLSLKTWKPTPTDFLRCIYLIKQLDEQYILNICQYWIEFIIWVCHATYYSEWGSLHTSHILAWKYFVLPTVELLYYQRIASNGIAFFDNLTSSFSNKSSTWTM